MLQLEVAYPAGSWRALAHAQRGRLLLRRHGLLLNIYPLEATLDALDAAEHPHVIVTEASEPHPLPADWRLAAVGACGAAGASLIARGVLRPQTPALVWADQPAWAEQWAARHPNHHVLLVTATPAEVQQRFYASATDALLLAADAAPPLDARPEPTLVPPLGHGLQLWWAPAADSRAPDLLSPLHDAAAAESWRLSVALVRAYIAAAGERARQHPLRMAEVIVSDEMLRLRAWPPLLGSAPEPIELAGAAAEADALVQQLAIGLLAGPG